jgi:hypothetical protein
MVVLQLAAISRGQQVLRPSGPQGQIRVSVGRRRHPAQC